MLPTGLKLVSPVVDDKGVLSVVEIIAALDREVVVDVEDAGVWASEVESFTNDSVTFPAWFCPSLSAIPKLEGLLCAPCSLSNDSPVVDEDKVVEIVAGLDREVVVEVDGRLAMDSAVEAVLSVSAFSANDANSVDGTRLPPDTRNIS